MRRRNKTERGKSIPKWITVFISATVVPPNIPPNSGLSAFARSWYESLKGSSRTARWEPSDWAVALYMAAMLDSPKTAGFARKINRSMSKLGLLPASASGGG